MTAPHPDLPAEVRAVVATLANGPSTLIHHTNGAINEAFRHDLIEVTASGIDTRTLDWRTLYGLRARAAVAS